MNSTLTLQEIAELIGGELSGDAALEISGAATIRDARPGTITLADRPELARELAESSATAVIVPPGFQPRGMAFITVGDVRGAFRKVVERFCPPRPKRHGGISPSATISPTARLAEDVEVHPGATIGDDVTIGRGASIGAGVHLLAGCRIGEHVTIFPGAVLYENTIVGDRCLIHANVVLGAYGFGYETVGGEHRLSAQLGYVVLEEDVEVGACTTIDRGTYGPTIIGRGTKIDNQVMIAHNCRIGRHNMICSQVGVAGSTSTGDYVVMAGQVGVRDHVHIGDRAILGAKAGVMNDIPSGQFFVGIPATDGREQKLKQAALARLPEMRKELKHLIKQVEQLARQMPAAADRNAADRDAA